MRAAVRWSRRLRSHQGRLDRAAELVSTLAPDLDQPGVPEGLLARYLVARGDPRAGRELAERIVGRWIYAEENAFEILAMLDALVALQQWDALATFLPRARAASKALALIEPASDRAEGQARGATGDRTAAEDLLRRALAGFQRMGVVFEAALTKEQLAAVAPDRDTARLLGNQALATYEQLQATPHAERLMRPRPCLSISPDRRRQPPRQLQQRQRVAAGLRDDPVADPCVQRPGSAPPPAAPAHHLPPAP